MNKAKRKNILIDLSDLKHPNCGFGQIAIITQNDLQTYQ